MANSIDKPLNNKGNKRGLHPNSLKNLENGRQKWHNPNGRPCKDVSLTSLLKEEIEKVPLGEKQGRTWRQLLVLAWLTGAMKNPVLLKELLERVEGKVTQPVEASGTFEIKDTRELTDEELAVIAATNIIRDNAIRRSRGTAQEATIP